MSSRAHLSNGGVDFIAEVVDGALVVRYWGKKIGNEIAHYSFERSIPNSDFDSIQNPGVLREHSRGWIGYPTLSGHRSGKAWSSHFEVTDIKSGKDSLFVKFVDSAISLELELNLKIDSSGVIRMNYSLLNQGDDYALNELVYWLPLSDKARESLDFAGRWSNERNPQRKGIDVGRWVRESFEGRSGHNFTIGEIALTKETNFATGEAWSIALAWSGDVRYSIEKNYEGVQAIGASEILAPGEIILAKGESYKAPELIAVYSESGLDGLANRYHQHLRARPDHPKKPRPITLNMWEAIYFDHSEERVRKLVDVAARVGVERVVLDDGWFGKRRNDRLGLGDWQVSKEVWPNGLRPISDYVASKGMEFGLWFEGEMLNADSDVYRNHPEWILSEQGRTPPTWRHQLVINLANPDAFKYVLDSISKVISEADVRYIKWDHNRVLVDAGYLGKAAIHKQTHAIYKLFKELKERHPGLEIESCSSGGGRIDFGVVDYVDRFWVSDNNDALARQQIQRWTMQFMPPELLGTHIGPTPGHQTGRVLSLPFRAATALFGHAGIEWDITQVNETELNLLKSWIEYYKVKRSFIHSGKVVRADYPDENHYLHGVIGEVESLFAYVQLQPIKTSHAPNLRFTGLNREKKYRVTVVEPAGEVGMMLIQPPKWLKDGVEATGAALIELGLPAPILQPAQALLIEIKAI
jgi:alpha-galactosidase